VPNGGFAPPGVYGFGPLQLQIFAATLDRPFLGAPSFSGTWQVAADVSPTPLPAALPLFAAGLGVISLLGWRRKRKDATT
jgi:hypothetical protein